jgi:hypothetical protein
MTPADAWSEWARERQPMAGHRSWRRIRAGRPLWCLAKGGTADSSRTGPDLSWDDTSRSRVEPAVSSPAEAERKDMRAAALGRAAARREALLSQDALSPLHARSLEKSRSPGAGPPTASDAQLNLLGDMLLQANGWHAGRLHGEGQQVRARQQVRLVGSGSPKPMSPITCSKRRPATDAVTQYRTAVPSNASTRSLVRSTTMTK